jgi:hypothetical protein
MTQPERPSNCHPDLQEDRLLTLAQFFASTRSTVTALHDPLSGDDGWSLGCRSFARWRNLLLNKAKTGEWPWLSIISPGKKFIFAIGSIPVRFYRGSYSKPPFRTLAFNAQELTQLSLAFASTEVNYKYLKWRFAIETDYLGEPSSVIFASMSGDDGAVIFHWKLPFDTATFNIDLISIRSDDMVELPSPIVSAPMVRKFDASNNA